LTMAAPEATTSPFLLHPDYIQAEGLRMCHVDDHTQSRRCRERNVRVFKSHYGSHPLHLGRVFRDMQIIGEITPEEAKKKSTFVAFMVACNFLRCYETLDVRNARFNINLDDLAECSWRFVDKIAALKGMKIRCPTEWPVRIGASVDGTHALLNEPRDPNMRRNPENFSFKHNFAGLNYQIVLSLWTNHVYYINAGDPASVHDMTAIRKEFMAMVPPGAWTWLEKDSTLVSDTNLLFVSLP
jgi:hypothetical protein